MPLPATALFSLSLSLSPLSLSLSLSLSLLKYIYITYHIYIYIYIYIYSPSNGFKNTMGHKFLCFWKCHLLTNNSCHRSISICNIYIYIYAFSRRFYPKRLTLHSSYSFYIFVSSCFPWESNHDLGVASAMLYYLSYRKALIHYIKYGLIY